MKRGRSCCASFPSASHFLLNKRGDRTFYYAAPIVPVLLFMAQQQGLDDTAGVEIFHRGLQLAATTVHPPTLSPPTDVIILCTEVTRVVFEENSCTGFDETEPTPHRRLALRCYNRRPLHFHSSSDPLPPGAVRDVCVRLFNIGDISGVTTTMLLHAFRPRLLLMTGVAVGNPAKALELGDLLLARSVIDINSDNGCEPPEGDNH